VDDDTTPVDDDTAVDDDTVADTTPPTISFTPLDGIYYTGADVTVDAYITDASGIASATVYYRAIGDSDWSSVDMTPLKGKVANNYTATLPGADMAALGTEYYLAATDNSDNSNVATVPVDAPTSFYSFNVYCNDQAYWDNWFNGIYAHYNLEFVAAGDGLAIYGGPYGTNFTVNQVTAMFHTYDNAHNCGNVEQWSAGIYADSSMTLGTLLGSSDPENVTTAYDCADPNNVRHTFILTVPVRIMAGDTFWVFVKKEDSHNYYATMVDDHDTGPADTYLYASWLSPTWESNYTRFGHYYNAAISAYGCEDP